MRKITGRRAGALLAAMTVLASFSPVTADFIPRQVNCVGSPPRQAEDPLSPPCKFYFGDDNGGSTWHGVEADEVRIVLYNDLGLNGDMTARWRPTDEQPGHELDPDRTYLARTVKALLRYFTARYMTYGRRPAVYAFSSQGTDVTSEQRRGDAAQALGLIDPFASVRLGRGGEAFMVALAEAERMNFGAFDDLPAATFTDHAPYLWSFSPDTDTQAALSAGFVCRSLLDDGSGGHATARFATGSALQGLPRTIGLVSPDRGGLSVRADTLADAIAATCGGAVRRASYNAVDQTMAAAGAMTAMTEFADADVTTVICYCETEGTLPASQLMQTAAFALGYGPEWFWDPVSELDDGATMRRHDAFDAASFGITTAARAPHPRETYAYRAYLSEEPGTTPNLRHLDEIYHALLMLFTAIQVSGPSLQPLKVQAGMTQMAYRELDNPFVPAGGFEPDMPSPFTFVDTGMSWWWDPRGTPPGGRQGEGCVRAADAGARRYADTWPLSDAALFTDDAPCSGDRRL